METFQQKMVKAKKGEHDDAQKGVKRFCKEFWFIAGMLKALLTEDRKKQ